MKTSCKTLKLSERTHNFSLTKRFAPKIFNESAITDCTGYFIWTDGTNVYFSNNYNHYIFNKEISAWESKTWDWEPTITNQSFCGNDVWTDGTYIYVSTGSKQWVLDGNTWKAKTWNWKTDDSATTAAEILGAECIWADGENIYLSMGNYSTPYDKQWVFNKELDQWEIKTWNGVENPNPGYIWTDGTNIYYSDTTNNYVLNKETSTWETKTWNGLSTTLRANAIWTDGTNIYFSMSNSHYILDVETSAWLPTSWGGTTSLIGSFYVSSSMRGWDRNYFWTDGVNLYNSSSGKNAILLPTTAKIYQRVSNGSSNEWVEVSEIQDSPLPIEVSNEVEMNALLKTAEVGTVYKYTGSTTDVYEKGALYIVEINLIQFTIDGAEYQAEDGMTWDQWVDSAHNTGKFKRIDVDDNGCISTISCSIGSSDAYALCFNGDVVSRMDTINANSSYITEYRYLYVVPTNEEE